MLRVDHRLAVAALIAIAGVVVAWRALHRPSAAPPATAARQIEGLTPADGLTFRPLTDESSIATYLNQLGAMVESEAPDAIASIGAPPTSTPALTTLVTQRLRTVVSPEHVKWREVAQAEGAEEFPTLADTSPVRRERHLGWTDWWRQARFATAGVTVRHLRMDDERAYVAQVDTASRNVSRARYPVDDYGAVVEVVIPVMAPSSPGGPPDTAAHLGIAYWWDRVAQRWRPVTATVYTKGGVEVIAPPM